MRILSWVLWAAMVVSAVGALTHRPLLGVTVVCLVAGLAVDKHRAVTR